MPCPRRLSSASPSSSSVCSAKSSRRMRPTSPLVMKWAGMLGMVTWSRITSIGSSSVDAGTAQRDVDEGALRPAQLGHGLLGGPAGEVLVARLGDHVAAAQALLVRRRPFEHPHDGDVAVERLNGDAEAVVALLLTLAHLGVGARVHEARMRVERLQHAVDAAVDEPIGLDRLGVFRLDGRQRRGERSCSARARGLRWPGRYGRARRQGRPTALPPAPPPSGIWRSA